MANKKSQEEDLKSQKSEVEAANQPEKDSIEVSKQERRLEREKPQSNLPTFNSPSEIPLSIPSPTTDLSYLTVEALQKASILVKSGILPASVNTAQKAVAIMQKGKELGFPPMASFKHLPVVNGTPSPDGAAIGALLRRRGIEWEIIKNAQAEYEVGNDGNPVLYVKSGSAERKATPEQIAQGLGKKKRVDVVTEIKFFRRSITRKDHIIEHTAKFTYRMAATAGLHTKDSWKKYLESMLFWRTLSIGGRQIAPDAFFGLPSAEELDETGKVYYNESGEVQYIN